MTCSYQNRLVFTDLTFPCCEQGLARFHRGTGWKRELAISHDSRKFAGRSREGIRIGDLRMEDLNWSEVQGEYGDVVLLTEGLGGGGDLLGGKMTDLASAIKTKQFAAR